MKKKISILTAAVLAAAIFAGCGSKDSRASKGKQETNESGDVILHAATQTDYPPFCFVDENDKLTGFDAELLRLISDRLDGYTIEVKGGEWESMFVSLDSNKLDLVADEVAITAEREENYYFSEPYIEIQSVIAVAEDNNDINSIDDLVGKHVLCAVDSYAALLESYNEQHDDKIILDYVDDIGTNERIIEVANGKYDAIVNDPITMSELISTNNIQAKIVGEPLATEPAAIVFAKTKDGEKLKELIDPVIRELKEDGTLPKLSTEWTGGDYIPD